MLAILKKYGSYNISSFLTLFFIPFLPIGSSISLALLFLSFLYLLFFTKELIFVKNVALITIAFIYLTSIIGLLWTNNIPLGLKILEYKLSFILVPIVFSFNYSKFKLWFVLKGLLLGNLVATIYLIINLLSKDFSPVNSFSSAISPIIHPTYLSMYFTLGIAIIIYGNINNKITISKKLIYLTVIVWTVLIFFLLSFAAILYLLTAVFIGYNLYAFFRWKWKGILVSLLITSLGFWSILNSSVLSYDFETTKETITQTIEAPVNEILIRYKDATSGTKERVVLWIISYEIIQENWFGSGTGNISELLSEKYEKYDLQVLKKNQLNPHNQFLQSGVELGILGLIPIVFLCLYLIYLSIKQSNILLFILVSNLIFNCIFESILERQFGIIFSLLLIAFFTVYNDQIKSVDE